MTGPSKIHPTSDQVLVVAAMAEAGQVVGHSGARWRQMGITLADLRDDHVYYGRGADVARWREPGFAWQPGAVLLPYRHRNISSAATGPVGPGEGCVPPW